MTENNVVPMRAPRANRTRYASAADSFSIDALISDLDRNGAISGGYSEPTIDTYVTARSRRAA